jgi:hypothetical protein
MNLFRSEDHIRSWAQFKEGTEEGIIPLENLLKLVSVGLFRRRLDPDYVSRRPEFMEEFVATLDEIGKTGQFWRRPK